MKEAPGRSTLRARGPVWRRCESYFFAALAALAAAAAFSAFFSARFSFAHWRFR
jgi:hypothetical protein